MFCTIRVEKNNEAEELKFLARRAEFLQRYEQTEPAIVIPYLHLEPAVHTFNVTLSQDEINKIITASKEIYRTS